MMREEQGAWVLRGKQGAHWVGQGEGCEGLGRRVPQRLNGNQNLTLLCLLTTVYLQYRRSQSAHLCQLLQQGHPQG